MKKGFTIILFWFTFNIAYTQNSLIDSLTIQLNQTKDPIFQIDILTNLSQAYTEVGLINKSNENAKLALNLSKKHNYKKGIATSYYCFARLNQYKNDTDLAFEFHNKAIPIFEKLNEKEALAWVYLNKGIIYSSQKKPDLAIKYDTKALLLFESIQNKKGIAYSYLNLSIVYNNIKKYDLSILSIEKTEKICREIGDKKGIGYAYAYLASIYKSLEKYDLALKFYNKAIEINKESNDQAGIARNYSYIGRVYYILKLYKKANDAFDQAIKISKPLDIKEVLKNSYLGHAISDSSEGNFKEAYYYYRNYIKVKDSISNSESGRNALRLQSEFEKDKTKLDLKVLQKEKEKEHLLNLEEHKIFIISILAAIIITIIIGVFSYFLYKRFILVERQKLIILKQKERNDEIHKKMKDSVVYASRIQRALITSEEYIFRHSKLDFFIFYEPKDIVSGDFYWAVEHQNKFYLVTGDCTGHGVPGAFMSLLNISILNDIIIEKNISSPAQILNEQRNQIIKALNPNGTENSYDGMDCVLCQFDLENLILNISAANIPLWIFRNGELISFKGDKMHVGMYSEEIKDFTEQSIQLQKGDLIYTFTDGIPDQFGGKNNKKLKSKNLTDFLKSIQHYPLNEQKVLIDKMIKDWKGELDQTDDMLIIGIRI